MTCILFIARQQGTNGSSSERYLCVGCQQELAAAADQISVAGRPPRQTYVNPHGMDCDIVTLAACRGYRPAAYSSTENTWFASYAWRPLGCNHCGGFLGWRFEAVADTGGGPRRFYGLLTDRLLVV